MIVAPLQFAQSQWYRGRWIFKHVVTYAEHVVLNVRVPHHLSNVYGESAPIHGTGVLVEFLNVIADKVPLVQSEELSGTCGHLETPVNFQHPAKKKTLIIICHQIGSMHNIMVDQQVVSIHSYLRESQFDKNYTEKSFKINL